MMIFIISYILLVQRDTLRKLKILMSHNELFSLLPGGGVTLGTFSSG